MFSISDVLTVQLLGNSKLDQADQMRVSIFCLECERLSKELFDLDENLFIAHFIHNIKETTGYMTFNGFCVIDEKGLIDIAERCYNVIELNRSKEGK